MEDRLTFTRTLAVLGEYGKAFADLYKRNLEDKGKVASGALIDSVTYRVDADGGSFEVVLSLEKYWKYIEGGIQPAGVFGNPGWKAYPHILNWISVKPIVPRMGANGKVPTPKQLAGAITHKIVTEGIEPVPVMAETAEELNAAYLPRIRTAFVADTQFALRAIVSTGFSSPLR